MVHIPLKRFNGFHLGAVYFCRQETVTAVTGGSHCWRDSKTGYIRVSGFSLSGRRISQQTTDCKRFAGKSNQHFSFSLGWLAVISRTHDDTEQGSVDGFPFFQLDWCSAFTTESEWSFACVTAIHAFLLFGLITSLPAVLIFIALEQSSLRNERIMSFVKS